MSSPMRFNSLPQQHGAPEKDRGYWPQQRERDHRAGVDPRPVGRGAQVGDHAARAPDEQAREQYRRASTGHRPVSRAGYPCPESPGEGVEARVRRGTPRAPTGRDPGQAPRGESTSKHPRAVFIVPRESACAGLSSLHDAGPDGESVAVRHRAPVGDLVERARAAGAQAAGGIDAAGRHTGRADRARGVPRGRGKRGAGGGGHPDPM
jgi:hypothetical protein